MEWMNVIMVIVTVFFIVVGIDHIIGTFFAALEEHQRQSNKEAIKTIKEIFNDFPKVVLDTVDKINELEEEKENKRRKDFEDKIKDIENYEFRKE